jgi:hypothetical protein
MRGLGSDGRLLGRISAGIILVVRLVAGGCSGCGKGWTFMAAGFVGFLIVLLVICRFCADSRW